MQLKQKKIKGYSGLRKAELIKLLETGKRPDKKKNQTDKKKNQTTTTKQPSNKPLLITMNTTTPDKAPPLSNKSLVELYKMSLALKKTINDEVNTAEIKKQQNCIGKS